MTEPKNKTEGGFLLTTTYSSLPSLFFSYQNPEPVSDPSLVLLNKNLAQELGLSVSFLEEEGPALLAGNALLEGARPLAQAYAGHQFGYFTRLGDGRAILLGEHRTPSGKYLDVQLKGAGRTPYSRRGDGRGALGPMLREYVVSEAMHALGIPSTRSLAVVATGEVIRREKEQKGAILTRVAASHIRVGTFQYAAAWGTQEDLRALADYTLQRHFPEAAVSENPYLFLLEEVIKRQADLIAKWQLVGFIHGVMNTDNMAVSGETIDYGPCAFMDTYDRATVFSSIDTQGRYAYGNQPSIALWNLTRFAETLLPLLDLNHDSAMVLAKEALTQFLKLYHSYFQQGMRLKLGLFSRQEEDDRLVADLLSLMEQERLDYTRTFYALTRKEPRMLGSALLNAWYKEWQIRSSQQEEGQDEVEALMQSKNPVMIPRNHLVEEALVFAEEKEDLTKLLALLEAFPHFFDYSFDRELFLYPPSSPDPTYRTFCGT